MYHKGCVAIPDYAAPPKDWVCPECKKKQRKGDNDATPVKNVTDIHPSLPTSETHLFSALPPEDSDVRVLRQELAEYMAEQREFREELRASMARMGARMDAFEQRLDALERHESSSAAENSQITELQQTINKLKLELNERDQEALQTDLDIGHIPEEKGENISHTVTVLAAKLGVTLEARDIVFAERVGAINVNATAADDGGARMRARRVVVRLARRELRDELMRAARVRRNLSTTDIGLAGPSRRVYVNERLTKTNRLLFYRARVECAKRQWRYSWTKRGRVFVRQGEGQQIHPIRSDIDLQRIFGLVTV